MIGRRTKDETSLSDSTCTPKWVADLLPEVDLDPASNGRSHIKARWSYSLEKGLDGLKLPWRGSVFENHPYSDALPWMLKTNYELSIGRCTDAIVLTKLDPSTEWWGVLTAPIMRDNGWRPPDGHDWSSGKDGGIYVPKLIAWGPDLWLFNDRIQFDEHPELIALRAREVAEGKRKGRKDGKSSNNFASAIVHHRFMRPALDLGSVATRWLRVD